MKRLGICLGLAVAVGLAGVAFAQGPRDASEGVLAKVELMQLAEAFGLEEAETVRLVMTFSRHQTKLQELCEQRQALRARVDAAAPGDNLTGLLHELMDADEQILDAKLAAFEAMAVMLDPYQKARVYVFVMDLMRRPEPRRVGEGRRAMAPVSAPVEPEVEPEEPADDEALVRATTETLKDGLEALDIDLVMEAFSPNFEHVELGGKEEARYMLEMAMDMGYADDGEVSIDDIQIEFIGNEALVYPFDLSAPAGSVTLELVLEKVGDEWLIKTINVDGL